VASAGSHNLLDQSAANLFQYCLKASSLKMDPKYAIGVDGCVDTNGVAQAGVLDDGSIVAPILRLLGQRFNVAETDDVDALRSRLLI
jgi:hypothetical protein